MVARGFVSGAVAVLLGAGLVSCGGGSDAPATAAAKDFLAQWSHGDIEQASKLTDNQSAAQAMLQQTKEALKPASSQLKTEKITVDGDKATASYSASWSLTGFDKPWDYQGRLELKENNGKWLVHWQPSVVHPQLTDKHRLVVNRALPDRAVLSDRNGKPLFAPTKVINVGVQPSKVTDVNALAATLADALHIDRNDIVSDIRKAQPDQFVLVITLRESDYLAVKQKIQNLPGMVFNTRTEQLPPSSRFGQPLLGRIGQATADVIKESGSTYQTGDVVGTSGLQRALNSRLTGKAGGTINIVGTSDAAGGAETSQEIGSFPSSAGQPIKLTIDSATQDAAESAVNGISKHAAIVAVKPSTGELLAVANGKDNPYDIALTGQYPAGSTFKTITATALLAANKANPATPVQCPGKTTVGGKVFQNQNAFDLGEIPLQKAFAKSCNTTFTQLSQQLDNSELSTMASQFGIGAEWQFPVDSFSGSLPTPKDETERAADAIGQGKVLVSPLSMALVAATAQHGSAPTPSLIMGEEAKPKNAPKPPPASALGPVRDFMRAVVTEGTATDLADLPGEPVAGKTGTAEYGTDTPPKSHAWFIGYRGDLAFAVFIEDGESSHTTAVPVAKAFLSALPT